ncbi:hypothetical protein Aph02nite_34690 [Actinoplanes philippinensis]|uniref:Uncharacterized protein n=2 Tax=Actinoplanes philippinensis TaxID=35752 RepID=A0A1I2F8W2_9ACTN|nr:hypothetical protein Aph02nite_34690 [Actinoplanes philippinensis]SFF00980.1 hypothetical protein SAMN05421541_105162 [Actinoplanes philippinensis]
MVWPAPPAPPPAPVGPVVAERVVAGPLGGRTAAWLTVGDAAARVRVRFARLPGLLYRISTAADAGVVPVVDSRGGRVTVRLTEAAGDGLDEVWIVLNRDVRWDIRLPAGAGEQQLNLRDGRVQRVEVGSAGLAEVWLPEPDGTVPVVFTGGIGTAVVSVRRGTPVRIHLTQGAGSVETPWTANNGTAAGTVLREPAFRPARNRVAIRADGGIGALVIRRPSDIAPQPDAPDPVVREPGRGTAPSGPGSGPAARRGAGAGPADRQPGHARRDATPVRPGRGADGGVPGRGSGHAHRDATPARPGRGTDGGVPGRGSGHARRDATTVGPGRGADGGVQGRGSGHARRDATPVRPGRGTDGGVPGRAGVPSHPRRSSAQGEPRRDPTPAGPDRAAGGRKPVRSAAPARPSRTAMPVKPGRDAADR